MLAGEFRRLALELPGASDGSHMGHADFRLRKRIFATLGHPDKAWGMVKLTPEQQQTVVDGNPAVFSPVPGGWGRRGCTLVRLKAGDRAAVQAALTLAWKNIAPKTLLAELQGDTPEARENAFARVRACVAAAEIPGIEESTSYGTASLKVSGKFLLRIKDADTLVLRCDLEEKRVLMEMAPATYFETNHYRGWPAVLVRLSKIDDDELQHRLMQAWRLVAPKRMIAGLQKGNLGVRRKAGSGSGRK